MKKEYSKADLDWLLGDPDETTIIVMWKYHTGDDTEPHHQHQTWFETLWHDEPADEPPSPRTMAKLKALLETTPQEIRNKFADEETDTTEEALTQIPINGWTEEHIGQEVRLLLPQGTIITDTITSMELPLMQQALIGPANELGMILARQDFWQRALIAQDIMEEMFKDNKHEDFKE